MKLSEVTGSHLVTAYATLYPTEISGEDVSNFANIFDAWLEHIREGKYQHQISLGQNYTAKKTRALLWLLDPPLAPEHLTVTVPPFHVSSWPAAMPALIAYLNSFTDLRTRISRRARFA